MEPTYMKPRYIEQRWSTDPPEFFAKEVVVCLPSLDEPVEESRNRETEIRDMRNLDGTPGQVLLSMKGESTATSLYHAILNHFGDPSIVRFSGECLGDLASAFIRNFSEEAGSQGSDVFRLVIETGIFSSDALDNLSLLLNTDSIVEGKNSYIDDIVIKLAIPSEPGYEWMGGVIPRISSSIIDCVSALGIAGLNSITIGMIVGEESSLVAIEQLISEIKKACNLDDRFPDLQGETPDLHPLAYESIKFCFFPINAGKIINDMILKALDTIVDSGFDPSNINVIPKVIPVDAT